MMRTRRCTRAGGNVGFEINVTRARRVNLVVGRQQQGRFERPVAISLKGPVR